jgi:capsular polysaccharide biosynthesis protein
VGEDLLPSLVELTRSPAVLRPAIDELDLATTPEQLAGTLEITALEDTAVLEISATAPTAREAALVAGAVGERLRDLALSMYPGGDDGPLLEVTTVIEPREPAFQTSPNTRTDTALGSLAGAAAAVLLTGLGALLRPRVRNAADVAALTDVPVLATLHSGGARAESVTRLLWAVDSAAPSGSPIALTGPSAGVGALADELLPATTKAAQPAAAPASRTGTTGPDGRPRVVHVADPRELRGAAAQGVDGLVVVVDAGRTTRTQLQATLAAAGASSVPLLGVVVDGVLPPGPGRRAELHAALRGDAPVPHGRWSPPAAPGTVVATSTRVTAVAALLALGLNAPLPMATTTGLLAAVVLLPVWAPALLRFHGSRTLVVLALLGLLSGALLAAWSSVDHTISAREAAEAGFLVLTALGALGLLLWARTVLPLAAIAVAYGLGQLAAGVLAAPLSVNPYKFQIALPLTIIVLALTGTRRRPGWALGALALLGSLAVTNDARSAAAFCVLTAALVLWQARPASGRVRDGRWSTGLLLAGVGVGGYLAISQLLVAGALGADLQARTVTQIRQSGSLLLGGRPEWTATWALMREHPQGFGLGTVPNAADVHLAEQGFAVTNIPTAEGYLRNYLFHGRFELHSIVADLWAHLGPVGLVLGLAMLALLARSLLDLLARRQAGALVCFLVLGALWKLSFGSLAANLPDVALALGLVLLPRLVASGHRPAQDPADAAGERRAEGVAVGRASLG